MLKASLFLFVLQFTAEWNSILGALRHSHQQQQGQQGQARSQTQRLFKKKAEGKAMLKANSTVPQARAIPSLQTTTTGGPCECPEGRATIVLADSNSGSTWLGQLLHRHPCASSFIPPGQLPDGKFRPKDVNELTMTLWTMRKASKGRSFGVVLSPQYLGRLLPEILKLKHQLIPQPVNILFLYREPIFQAISFLKKAELLQKKRHDGVECENVNQRGGKDCGVAARVTISPKPRDLQKVIDAAKATHAQALQHSSRATRAFDDLESEVLEMKYVGLVCAQAFRGRGFLPAAAATFTGLGLKCPSKNTFSVKVSPGNPARSLRNLEAVRLFANHTSQEWEESLSRPAEALCDDQGHARKPSISLPGPLLLLGPLPTRTEDNDVSTQPTGGEILGRNATSELPSSHQPFSSSNSSALLNKTVKNEISTELPIILGRRPPQQKQEEDVPFGGFWEVE